MPVYQYECECSTRQFKTPTTNCLLSDIPLLNVSYKARLIRMYLVIRPCHLLLSYLICLECICIITTSSLIWKILEHIRLLLKCGWQFLLFLAYVIEQMACLGITNENSPMFSALICSKRLLIITITASHNSDVDFGFELVSKYILHVPWKKWYEARWHHKMEFFSRYWPFVRGFPRSPVNSPHKGWWRGALCFLWFTSEHTVE